VTPGRAGTSHTNGTLKTTDTKASIMDQSVIEAGEMDVEELLEAIESGERVVVRTEFLGADHEITLRYDGETYYCDTPTRLHKHDSRTEMRTCLEKQGYARTE
jgi:formylmethanofuran dehydrogenase subunit A